MFSLRLLNKNRFSKFVQQQRQICLSENYFNKAQKKLKYLPSSSERLQHLQEKYEDKIIYNTLFDSILIKRNYTKKGKEFYKRLVLEEKSKLLKRQSIEPLPVSLKYILKQEEDVKEGDVTISEEVPVIFPFDDKGATPVGDRYKEYPDNYELEDEPTVADTAQNEVKERQQQKLNNIYYSNWMMDYDNYEDCDEEGEVDQWRINYGTSDPNSAISKIPCGGCGALLHCKDTALPGYIPSEIFKNSYKTGGVHLNDVICQRCYFLKHHNLALQVRVTSDDYPKILETIKDKRALIILLVDLLDFPCSVWPGIGNTLGLNKPIVIVGNKVDLLPRDSRGYLDRIKETLKQSIFENMSKESMRNIKHVGLISAKTGWGVEELITKLHNLWRGHGDVYLVGCTNAGKSTLFNSLLQSDLCKVQAADLIQRATTSTWPGTTLNLLKFPILRPSGWKLFVRTKRLQSLKKLEMEESRLRMAQLKQTNDPKYATLIGHLDRTFTVESSIDSAKDPFSVGAGRSSTITGRFGINENDPAYAAGKWCYDTPGVVQPDQIIHLLTAEEVLLTLPKQLLRPQTFTIRVGQTFLIGGLARLDYIDGPYSVKLTVFCSDSLPLTLCVTEHADTLYKELLGTELLQVPKGSEERLSKWPRLEKRDVIKLTGVGNRKSCNDIVLSNAGWASVTCSEGQQASFNAWTPEARGIYVRSAVLPYAVELRGNRIRTTPAFTSNKFFIPA